MKLKFALVGVAKPKQGIFVVLQIRELFNDENCETTTSKKETRACTAFEVYLATS